MSVLTVVLLLLLPCCGVQAEETSIQEGQLPSSLDKREVEVLPQGQAQTESQALSETQTTEQQEAQPQPEPQPQPEQQQEQQEEGKPQAEEQAQARAGQQPQQQTEQQPQEQHPQRPRVIPGVGPKEFLAGTAAARARARARVRLGGGKAGPWKTRHGGIYEHQHWMLSHSLRRHRQQFRALNRTLPPQASPGPHSAQFLLCLYTGASPLLEWWLCTGASLVLEWWLSTRTQYTPRVEHSSTVQSLSCYALGPLRC